MQMDWTAMVVMVNIAEITNVLNYCDAKQHYAFWKFFNFER